MPHPRQAEQERATAPLHWRLSAELDTAEVDLTRLTARIRDRTVDADTVHDLQHALANALYEVLHTGLDISGAPRLRTLRDPSYERLLADAVPHRDTTFAVPYAAVAESGDDPSHRIVTLEGVRTLVPAASVTASAGEGRAVVHYPCARPALSAGFFLVDGSAGRPDEVNSIVRLYIHLKDARTAPPLWRDLLHGLEARTVRYRAKISSSPLLYPRRDAAVVYLSTAEAGHTVAQDLAAGLAGRPGLGRSTSVFAREIVPGLAVAEEPDDPRTGQAHLSFGLHRAHAVAQGLIDHARSPRDSDVRTVVCAALARAHIRPDAPWRNASR
ncbi:T3SS effector HopA1 family protein [Streptomyces sp. MST-110588]|uniref:T3SS effector HopA1 family protein n=1 Tax=Streptomyces sp. MST-110588 TaxID=2833628 RepID=UPI001F5C0C70|nr:T3SS effector HopA1 family protein [Streptomyces sp. MST-110588]UNO41786.1 hypothetical protein KGS77_22365 [Streptomyces sp. MST-110588]